MKKSEVIEVIHIGSLWTITTIRKENGNRIVIKVRIKTPSPTIVNQHTLYCYSVSMIPKGHKLPILIKDFEENDNYGKMCTNYNEQDIYTALFNHWEKLNPLRIFSTEQTNSVLGNFTVEKIELNKEIKAY
jgi:hypothetical protein